MPSSTQEKMTAGFILLFLAECFSYTNDPDSFEFTNLINSDPRGIPYWLLENGLSYLGYGLPKPVVLLFKFFLPLIILYAYLEPSDNEGLGNNRHSLFNSELNKYNPYLENFIKARKAHPSFVDQLKDLELTDDEQQKLKEFSDSITDDLMETPVSVYGKYYDLETVKRLHPRRDPCTRISFTLRDIQPHPEIADKISTLIKEFHKARAQDDVPGESLQKKYN